jgi:hypothetical protein
MAALPDPWRLRAVLSVLAWAVAAYAVAAYALLPLGAQVLPAMREAFRLHPVILYGHVFGAALALLLGPFQFSARLRAAWPRLHRWAGRAYLGAGVGLGGVCGLLLSRHAQGGTVGRLGFACLALAWLYTGARGLLAIRAGEGAAHRAWMLRNHALTLAAVTLRLYLGGVFAARLPFDAAYAAIAWLCWVPNLLVAQWWLGRGPRLPTMRR